MIPSQICWTDPVLLQLIWEGPLHSPSQLDNFVDKDSVAPSKRNMGKHSNMAQWYKLQTCRLKQICHSTKKLGVFSAVAEYL